MAANLNIPDVVQQAITGTVPPVFESIVDAVKDDHSKSINDFEPDISQLAEGKL